MGEWVKREKGVKSITVHFDEDRIFEAMIAYAREKSGAKGRVAMTNLDTSVPASGEVMFDEVEVDDDM